MKKIVSIAIPIYKLHPSKEELCSLKQCYTILREFDIFIVTYKDLNISEYTTFINQDVRCVFFEKSYFDSIMGYNALLKEHIFYKSFKNYHYLLIYQLDAWVFEDSLKEWCLKGYDYIGAPWFTDFGAYKDGNTLWKVGNGGLSLRNIKKFMHITHPKTRYKSLTEVFKTEYKGGLKSLISCILRSLGHRNTIAYFKNTFRELNEDYYFSVEISQYKNLRLKIPTVDEAIYFSFERSPEYLYELTKHSLPFGCHAWEKYDKDFWKGKILITS